MLNQTFDVLARYAQRLNTSLSSAQGHGRPTSHKPEVILSGFGTRLGHRVSRLFGALFAQVC